MSRLYFHSPSGDAEVMGSERHYMSRIVSGTLAESLQLDGTSEPPLRALIEKGSYVHSYSGRAFNESVRTIVNILDDLFEVEGKLIETFALALNTAYVSGSDVIRLCARIHAQCESHCYIEGPNRKWFADIIEQGRKCFILRANQGWEDVVHLLVSRDDEPVVMSFSVCESFPNRYLSTWEAPEIDEDDEDAPDINDLWDDLGGAERWKYSMEGLRKKHKLEIKPDDWDSYFFMHGWNGYQLLEYAYSNREISQVETATARQVLAN